MDVHHKQYIRQKIQTQKIIHFMIYLYTFPKQANYIVRCPDIVYMIKNGN